MYQIYFSVLPGDTDRHHLNFWYPSRRAAPAPQDHQHAALAAQQTATAVFKGNVSAMDNNFIP